MPPTPLGFLKVTDCLVYCHMAPMYSVIAVTNNKNSLAFHFFFFFFLKNKDKALIKTIFKKLTQGSCPSQTSDTT